jgi:hypothetical protein
VDTGDVSSGRGGGVKRPGRETDHSLRSVDEVNIAFTPKFVFMAWCLIKHGENFIFTVVLSELNVAPNNNLLYYVLFVL